MTNYSILIVEDSEMMREFLKSNLSEKYLVNTAESGWEALAYLHSGINPDLIITDLNMPDMDGGLLLKNIKKNVRFSHIPVIVLSGMNKSSVRIKCLQGGAKDFIIKPFNPEELLLRVSKTLNAA